MACFFTEGGGTERQQKGQCGRRSKKKGYIKTVLAAKRGPPHCKKYCEKEKNRNVPVMWEEGCPGQAPRPATVRREILSAATGGRKKVKTKRRRNSRQSTAKQGKKNKKEGGENI